MTNLIRDALGSPVPQTLNEDGTFTVMANGDVSNVDFSKKKLLRDGLGSPLPYQYYDVEQGKFVPGVIGGIKTNNKKNGRLLTDCSNFLMWYGVVTHDTQHVLAGQKSIRISTDATNITSAARLRNVAFNFSNLKNMMVRFYVEDIDNLSNVELRMSSVDNMSKYLSFKLSRWRIISGWNEVMVPLESLTVNNAESLSNVMTTFQLSVTSKSADVVATVVFDSIYINRTQRAKILFHFDDGWTSQYTKAFPILLKYGFVGSIGVVRDFVGANGYMTLDQLRTLHTYGWDLFNHTTTHNDLTVIPVEQIKTELDNCRDWLNEQGFTEASDFVAYPYGSHNADVLEAMKGYKLGRITSEMLEVTPPIQPHRLKVLNMYPTINAAAYTPIINDAIKTGSTLILLFHRIDDTGSDNTIYLTNEFEALVSFIKSKESEVDVITTSEYFNSF